MRLKGPQAVGVGCRQGQATIEYVLMLATVVVVLSAFLTAFNTHIARWFFAFIGQMLTS